MKAILQSIKPQYCELIAAGKKTIEVRKSKPIIPTPFKVYIYCTKGEKLWKKGNSVFLDKRYNRLLQTFDYMLNGKVIGEYVCDSISPIVYTIDGFADVVDCELSCLGPDDFIKYGKGKTLYGYHISNLVIYDKPKELSEFRIIVKEYLTKCPFRSRVYNNPNFTNGALLPGAYICDADLEPDFCRGQCEDAKKPLTRPPQSWCYVEEV